MVSISRFEGGDSIAVENCRIYEAPRRASARQPDATTFWVPFEARTRIEPGQVYELKLDDGTVRKVLVRKSVSPNAMPGRTMFFGVVQE